MKEFAEKEEERRRKCVCLLCQSEASASVVDFGSMERRADGKKRGSFEWEQDCDTLEVGRGWEGIKKRKD